MIYLGKSIFHREVSNVVNSSGLVRIITTSAHGLATGNVVSIEGVGGTTEANGRWTITVVDATSFTLQGSVFANTYTSGTGIVYLPRRLKLQLSTSPTGGSQYVWASVSFRRVVDGSVLDADTLIFKLTNTNEVAVLDSYGGGTFRIDEIEFRNKSTTTVTVLVEIETHNETLEPASASIANNERVTWVGGASDVYSADGKRTAGGSIDPP
jgi:hypothetical protein